MSREAAPRLEAGVAVLLWVDLETTGLDPVKDAILEIALLVTDNDLHEVYAENHVLPFDLEAEVAGGRKVDPYVLEMHRKNDLWTACAAALPDLNATDAAAEIFCRVLDSVRRFTEPRTTPICGSTVAFDRGFLKVHAPALERHFSHRNLDVSVVGELAARWYPEVWEKRPRGDAHRALPDIRGSVELLRYWRGSVLR